MVLAVPSRDGLDVARERVRAYLAWEEVRITLEAQQALDSLRVSLLVGYIDDAKRRIGETVEQAWCIVVTVSDKNEVQAFKVAVTGDPLFTVIKGDARARIQEQSVNAEALLPDGPYNLWRDDETSRLAKDLVGAFAQHPHLPKMLRRQAIVDTLVLGARQGLFALRLTRPDRSARTLWRQEPTEADLKDPGLEVLLPEAAELADLAPTLLAPGVLPDLWPGSQELAVSVVAAYFGGGRVVQVAKEGYSEPLMIPTAPRPVIEAALRGAVEQGVIWLVSGPASLYREVVPAGVLSDSALLLPPPAAVPVQEVLPETLPEAWERQETTALSISVALSQRAGRNLPWVTIREAIDGAVRARFVERTLDSGPWPCDLNGAQTAKFRLPVEKPTTVVTVTPKAGLLSAEAELTVGQVQDLAYCVADLQQAAVGHGLRFWLRVGLGGELPAPPELVDRLNDLLMEISKDLELG